MITTLLYINLWITGAHSRFMQVRYWCCVLRYLCDGQGFPGSVYTSCFGTLRKKKYRRVTNGIVTRDPNLHVSIPNKGDHYDHSIYTVHSKNITICFSLSA